MSVVPCVILWSRPDSLSLSFLDQLDRVAALDYSPSDGKRPCAQSSVRRSDFQRQMTSSRLA